MTKIVLLQGKNTTDNIFSQDDIMTLSRMGEVYINPESGNPKPEDVKRMIKDADIAITSWGCPKMDKEILDNAPGLKLIVHAAGSVKGIVSEEVWNRNIRVSGSAEALGRGVAETALTLTIASVKNMWALSQSTRNGEWQKGREHVRELYNLTVGVVGAGRAGRHYIRLLKNFEVNILLYDPTLNEEQCMEIGAKKVSLDELMAGSDVVSIHAPSIPATDKMINSSNLSMMKDNAVLINTARGSIIDENALIGELKSGRIFACLDVTDPEPPCADSPFRKLPNVILLPHIAGAVNNGLHRIGRYTVSEIEKFINNRELDGEVTLSRINKLA
jgi:Phosphoglycerate dehydrogenase and related dehydrogenases